MHTLRKGAYYLKYELLFLDIRRNFQVRSFDDLKLQLTMHAYIEKYT
jgi:hypothetical protein